MSSATPISAEETPGIRAAASALRSRGTTSVELVELAFERLDLWEAAASLNTFVSTDRTSTLIAAAELDAELANGHDRGPLHGIPVSIKDNITVAGFTATAGSAAFKKYRPSRDAVAVRRLREAGAVIIGKNTLHELGLGDTYRAQVANPYDPARSAGGSSGGTAAAVSAGIVFAGLGTDSGGSVRMPAAWCGVVGVKATSGAVSTDGVMGRAATMDNVGPIARTAEDAGLVLAAVIEDPACRAVTAAAPQPQADRLPRVGLVRVQEATPEILRAVEQAAAEIAFPAEPQWVELGPLEDAIISGLATIWPECSVHVPHLLSNPDAGFGELARAALVLGRILPGRYYLDAQEKRRLYRRRLAQLLDGLDVLLLPTCVETAGALGTGAEFNHYNVEDTLRLIRYTIIGNVTGFPALSIPCGLDGAALPIGLQMIARPGDEKTLLATAGRYERGRPWEAPALP